MINSVICRLAEMISYNIIRTCHLALGLVSRLSLGLLLLLVSSSKIVMTRYYVTRYYSVYCLLSAIGLVLLAVLPVLGLGL